MFVFSGMYALPVGRGREFPSNANRLEQLAAGGWNVGAIISLLSGTPFNALAGGDIANVGGGDQRAERIGPAYAGPGFHQSPLEWVNRASFTTPTQYTFGNEGRNDLVGPSYNDVDFITSKDFFITEKTTFQFRAEFFNALNKTNYGIPTNSVQSSSFGDILSTNGTGREIQFAAKIIF
jgi:hypothetical protein